VKCTSWWVLSCTLPVTLQAILLDVILLLMVDTACHRTAAGVDALRG
jgi:hypothetical protein